jgi:hypothetical protein
MKLYKNNNKNKKMAINKSVTSLELNYSLILPGVLEEYSTRLPSLKNLYFRSCFFQKTLNNYEGHSNFITINMPVTAFTSITWHFDLHVQEDYLYWQSQKCYFNITTIGNGGNNKKVENSKYYHMNKDHVNELTKNAHKKMARSDYDSLKFEITCK